MPTWQKTKPDDPNDSHCGWVFADPTGEPYPNTVGLGGPFPAAVPGKEPDPEFGAKSIREIYERAGDTVGTYSVPILWDKKLKTIVRYVGFIMHAFIHSSPGSVSVPKQSSASYTHTTRTHTPVLSRRRSLHTFIFGTVLQQRECKFLPIIGIQ
jgi:hypothetical protein